MVLAATLVLSPLASAVDMIINTTNPTISNGDGKCSLIEAINNANADSSSIHIDCPAGVGADTLILSADTYTLNTPDIINRDNGLPRINSDITIQGNGAIIERAANASTEFRIIEVNTDAQLSLDQVTISGGKSSSSGAGILNFGTIILTNIIVRGNSSNGNVAAGIFNGGTMTITQSTVNNNSVDAAFPGTGGIHNTGTMTMTHSTISDNIVNAIVSSLSGSGGGILNSGTLTITHSTISGNSIEGDGGGISNSGTMTISQSTVNNNSAINGGGLFIRGTTILTNCTISGNSATNDGGGIFGSGIFGGFFGSPPPSLSHTTVSNNSAGNRGGGIKFSSNFSSIIKNSIISGNNAVTTGAEIHLDGSQSTTTTGLNVFGHSGLTTSEAFFNFIPQANSFIITTVDNRTPTALSSIINPVLADNDGFTLTHALVTGSPAIDAVVVADCNAIQDQRGAPRPVDGDGNGTANCDIGAVEFNSAVSGSIPLDIDGNNSSDALTDGLLIIRYLFGLRGDALISGAIGSGAINTTASDITDSLNLQATNNVLDIDGDGNTDALTDGLLIIRYLFGLRNNALIGGAIGSGATRSTAVVIEARIQALLGQ